jgi:hypothetical protein
MQAVLKSMVDLDQRAIVTMAALNQEDLANPSQQLLKIQIKLSQSEE